MLSKIRKSGYLLIGLGLITGCSSGNDARIAELEAELDQLIEDNSATSDVNMEQASSAPAPSQRDDGTPETVPTTPSTTTTTVLSKAGLLQTFVKEEGFDFSSGIFENVCGNYAVVALDGTASVLEWSGTGWELNPEIEDFFAFADQFAMNDLTEDGVLDLYDLTGDGIEEMVIRVDGGMRSAGAVFTIQEGDCSWTPVPIIDSCGSFLTYDGLYVESGELHGSGFSAGCSGRDGMRFVWSEPVERFIGRSSTREKVCDSFDYGEVMLPLTTCDEGWAVQMAQQHISNTGIQVDADGYFGPGTHQAVLQFQLRNNLEATGIVDFETWGSMYPADWDRGYPDYDGDGISTPVEMSHS